MSDTNTPIVTQSVNISQLVLGYSLSRIWKLNELQMNIEGFFSPGEVLANESDSDYDNLRPDAKNIYFYARFTVSDVYKFESLWSIAAVLRGQGATGPLLPSEQFGLGGYNSVRGYDERATNNDQAVCANFELRTPDIHLFSKKSDALVFLGFIDYGWGYNLDHLSGQKQAQYLLGSGPGLRYSIKQNLALRADYGFRLHKVQFGSSNLGRFHLGGTISY